MKRVKRGIALAIGTLVLLALASASSWEGSAMTGTVGDFPSSGYYAACNSFARNTTIDVTNLENGRTVTVIVTRGLESSGVFMMLSAEAATALGLQPGRLARIRAAEPRSAVELAPAARSGSAFDPDLNPRLLAAEELKRLGYELAPQTPAAPATTQPAAVAAAPEKGVAVTAPVPSQPVPLQARPVEPAKPAPIGRDVPPAPAVAVPPVLAPVEPAPVGKENPESLASAKPRPVRTIVLPQLPEPPEPAVAVAATEPASPTVTTAPEVSGALLPVPDETPIRVATTATPRRYEAPAMMPDVADRGPRAPVPTAISMALVDPEPAAAAATAESALAYSLSAPALSGDVVGASLADPAVPSTERVDAYSRAVPAMAPSDARAELAWPELEADEIPEVVLSHLSEPAPSIPATSLAEGELMLPDSRGPSAVALETPVYGAAETSVELAEAEPKGEEKPVAVGARLGIPADSAGSTGLANAEEQKPETAPMAAGPEPKPSPSVALEPPRDYVVGIEPAAPKPPVANPAPTAPAAADVSAPPPAASPAVAPAVAPAQASAPPSAAIVTAPLEKGRYYIQIGAYASEAAARDASYRLGPRFSTVVQKTTDKGRDTWRVFVGPLSRDESGVALVKVRSMGFKDAFVKSGG